MGVDVVGLSDGRVAKAERSRLPALLAHVPALLAGELKAIGLAFDQSKPVEWIWDWIPELDGAFEDWISQQAIVGISWPNKEGLSVLCSEGAVWVSIGVRWRAFIDYPSVHETVTKIVGVIGHQCGGRTALFVPDSGDDMANRVQDMFFDGTAFAELAAQAEGSTACRMIEYEIQES